MGARELAKNSNTEIQQNKVETLDAEITITKPENKQFKGGNDLPSPFDSMHMFPTVSIKNMSPVTNKYGQIEPDKEEKK